MVTREAQSDLLVGQPEIDTWPISTRVKTALRNKSLTSIDSIKQLSLEDLKEIPLLGSKGILEIRHFIYSQFGIVFKSKAVKKKRLTEPSDCKKIVVHFLEGHAINWANQLIIADRLIKKYGTELLLLVKPNPKVHSLLWYNSDYGHKYLSQYFPGEVIEEPKEIKPEIDESVEFVPVVSTKPKTLREFLKL